MANGFRIRQNQYYDSVFLMQVAEKLSQQPGIDQAAAMMGTDNNKVLLTNLGYTFPDILSAGSNDLIIVLSGKSDQLVNTILENLDDWLRRKAQVGNKLPTHTLQAAHSQLPNSNLVMISVPGKYAAREARIALEQGLNVFLFSSNVPLEDELSLKKFALDHGLIVMGPDCGTAIINGVGLGFANVVRRGPIGVVGAAGTGLQEFTSLVHRLGSGISHAIGTGGRDLSNEIRGISFLSALDALEHDPSTLVISAISKPPGDMTLHILEDRLKRCSKPIVACFLGLHKDLLHGNNQLKMTRTLDMAAQLAVELATSKPSEYPGLNPEELEDMFEQEVRNMSPKQKYVRGLFAGGTLCYQANQILMEGGLAIHSNTPLKEGLVLTDPYQSQAHSIIDMGAEVFTNGRPHPMIDATLRRERIRSEASDPEVAVLLLDFILGYNASPNPAKDLIEVIKEAKLKALSRGGYMSVVTSICGTDNDPQNLSGQIKMLKEAKAVVLPNSVQAALFARKIVSRLTE